MVMGVPQGIKIAVSVDPEICIENIEYELRMMKMLLGGGYRSHASILQKKQYAVLLNALGFFSNRWSRLLSDVTPNIRQVALSKISGLVLCGITEIY